MSTEVPQKQNGNSLSKIVGGVISIILILYLGYNFLIAIVGTLTFGWIANKILREEIKPMVPAIAIQSYQFLWLLLGFSIFGLSTETIIEALVLGGVLFWLVRWPGIIPVVILVIFQIIAFTTNLSIFLEVNYGSILHKTAFVHFLLRMGAVIFMISGLINIRRQVKGRDARAETEA